MIHLFPLCERHNNAKHASDVLSATLVALKKNHLWTVFSFLFTVVSGERENRREISHDMKRKKKKACGGSRHRGPNDLKEILCKHLRPRTFLSVTFHFINGIKTFNAPQRKANLLIYSNSSPGAECVKEAFCNHGDRSAPSRSPA